MLHQVMKDQYLYSLIIIFSYLNDKYHNMVCFINTLFIFNGLITKMKKVGTMKVKMQISKLPKSIPG